MKIHFSNVNFDLPTGPNVFAMRLKKQLEIMGHDIILNHRDKYDVFLCFIEPATHPDDRCCGSKLIVRLDGFWFKPGQEQNNNNMIYMYNKSDNVIIQTEFDRKFIEKYWGVRQNVSIIGNGIDLDNPSYPYPDIEIDDDEILTNFSSESKERNIFICSAHWTRQKRLLDNIKTFYVLSEQAESITGKKSAICYIGNIPDDIGKEAEKLLKDLGLISIKGGNISLKNINNVLKNCYYGIHLAYLDHFPNSVVEMLAAGLPVIHTNSGGTKEVVKIPRLMINEPEFNFELTDYDNPPIIDSSNFILPKEPPPVNLSHLDIKLVAEQYLKVFES